jgi:hypothetical protein
VPRPLLRRNPQRQFSKARVIEGPSNSITGTNVNSSSEKAKKVMLQRSQLFGLYRWIPANSGTVTFTTKGSTFDTTWRPFSV